MFLELDDLDVFESSNQFTKVHSRWCSDGRQQQRRDSHACDSAAHAKYVLAYSYVNLAPIFLERGKGRLIVETAACFWVLKPRGQPWCIRVDGSWADCDCQASAA